MHGEAGVDLGQAVPQPKARVARALARVHRVVVQRELHAVLALEVALDGVDDAMVRKSVCVAVHLHMRRHKAAAGAVIVHGKVVRVQDTGVGEDALAHGLHVFRLGRSAQQRADGGAHQTRTRHGNEGAHGHARPGVHVQTGRVLHERAGKDDAGGDDVVSGIGRGCEQRLGIDAAPQLAVKGEHPELYQHRAYKDRDQKRAELGGVGVHELVVGLLDQVHAQSEDDDGHAQAGHVLVAAVAVGVVRVCRLGGELKAGKAQDVARGVGEIVHSVGHDGDRAEQETEHRLGRAERHVADDAHDACKKARARALVRVLLVKVASQKDAYQQVGHGGSSNAGSVAPLSRRSAPVLQKETGARACEPRLTSAYG